MEEIKEVRKTKGIIGDSKVSKGWNMHLPKSVITRLNIHKGDTLLWAEANIDIPDDRVLDYMLFVYVKEGDVKRK